MKSQFGTRGKIKNLAEADRDLYSTQSVGKIEKKTDIRETWIFKSKTIHVVTKTHEDLVLYIN